MTDLTDHRQIVEFAYWLALYRYLETIPETIDFFADPAYWIERHDWAVGRYEAWKVRFAAAPSTAGGNGEPGDPATGLLLPSPCETPPAVLEKSAA